MNNITISIIIATWNAEKTLKRCLESIVPQLNNESELIIIDGGSKDSTQQIICAFKEHISFTSSAPDKGIYDAWNKGIKQVRGSWVMFIGADDVLLPNALSSYLEIIKSKEDIDNYDYICAHNEYVDKNGKILKIVGGEPKWSVFRRTMNAAHVASLHNKKNLFDKIGYYNYQDYHICADYELLLRKKEKLKALFIENHIARMEIGGMSFSTAAIKETFEIRKQHHSVPLLINYILYFRDVVAFKFFKLRKKLLGANI